MIRARKSLGQNFLTDHQVARRIIDAVSPGKTDAIIEIGSGTGALTGMLAKPAGYVVAVEIDARLAEELRRTIKAENLTIITADALSLNWDELIDDAKSKLNASDGPDPDSSRWSQSGCAAHSPRLPSRPLKSRS